MILKQLFNTGKNMAGYQQTFRFSASRMSADLKVSCQSGSCQETLPKNRTGYALDKVEYGSFSELKGK